VSTAACARPQRPPWRTNWSLLEQWEDWRVWHHARVFMDARMPTLAVAAGKADQCASIRSPLPVQGRPTAAGWRRRCRFRCNGCGEAGSARAHTRSHSHSTTQSHPTTHPTTQRAHLNLSGSRTLRGLGTRAYTTAALVCSLSRVGDANWIRRQIKGRWRRASIVALRWPAAGAAASRSASHSRVQTGTGLCNPPFQTQHWNRLQSLLRCARQKQLIQGGE
jgi:hypothetical protein